MRPIRPETIQEALLDDKMCGIGMGWMNLHNPSEDIEKRLARLLLH